MTDTLSTKSFNLKWFGTLTMKQLLALLGIFILAVAMTLFGFGSWCMCFGLFIIAAILCMLPRFIGVENIKFMTLFGVAFMAVVILLGAFVTAPMMADAKMGPPSDNDHFTDIEYTYTDSGMDITATVVNDLGPHEVYFKYGTISGIEFSSANANLDKKIQLTVTGNTATGSVELDPNSLYAGYLGITQTNDQGEEIENSGTFAQYWRYLPDAYEGSMTSLYLYGCFISTMYIMIVYFLVLVFSSFMRGRMEKVRDKMEEEGRLYPQGYGRCENCGAVVLPGEVNCRKCGAYIDRPEEMKHQKDDFFECSECGAEVPNDAAHCPKCGVQFDEDEYEVKHADGTVETTNEFFQCRECGAEVPATSTFCPRCGAKFDKKQ